MSRRQRSGEECAEWQHLAVAERQESPPLACAVSSEQNTTPRHTAIHPTHTVLVHAKIAGVVDEGELREFVRQPLATNGSSTLASSPPRIMFPTRGGGVLRRAAAA